MACDRSHPGCPTPSACATQRSTCTDLCSHGSDSVTISTLDGGVTGAGNPDSVLNAAEGWHVAEFNVFGDGCDSQANFNSGSTTTVRFAVGNGATTAPSCATTRFTGYTLETHNP